MRTRTAVLVAGFVLAAPATAGAATASVTGDDGADVALGSPVTLRSMAPSVKIAFAPGEARYAVTVTGPNGDVAGQQLCQAVSAYKDVPVSFAGDGRYTVSYAVSTSASDQTCTQGTTNTAQFTIDTSTRVALREKGTVLTRTPGDPRGRVHTLSVTHNPGSDRTEIRYAPDVKPEADGALPGSTMGGTAPAISPTFDVAFSEPGRYAFVSRAVAANGVAGDWSAPVYVQVKAPFDLVSAPILLDDTGPTYKLRGDVNAKLPKKSKIAVSVANGKRGGKFRAADVVRTDRRGRFTLRLTRSEPGRFRIRYRYRGNASVAAGRVTQLINVRKVFA